MIKEQEFFNLPPSPEWLWGPTRAQPVWTGGSFPGVKATRTKECMELHLQSYYTFLAGHRENFSVRNTLCNKLQKRISYSKCAQRTKLMNYHQSLKLQHCVKFKLYCSQYTIWRDDAWFDMTLDFWNMTIHCWVSGSQHFEGMCCLHIQELKVHEECQ